MWIKEKSDETTVSFNFVAPDGIDDKVTEELFPVTEVQAITFASSVQLAIAQMKTIAAITMTGALALTADVDSQVSKGALLLLKATASTANRVITFGTGFSGDAAIITAGTTANLLFVYDGTNFILVNPIINSTDAQTPAYAASIALAIAAKKTFVTVGQLTGALTLTAAADAALPIGAEVHVTLASDGTARDTTLSTGITGGTVAGVISKTKVITLVWTGTTFLHTATQQIN